MSNTTKNITNTFISTGVVLLLQVINIVLSTQLLGSEGRGQISLYLLHIAIGAQIGSVIGGEALVFFASRYNLKSIILLALKWNILTALLSFLVLYLFKTPIQIAIILGSAIFLQSSFQLLVQLSMGNMLIKKSNYSYLISQTVFTACILALHFTQKLNPSSFILAFMMGIVAAIIQMLASSHRLNPQATSPKLTFSTAFNNGIVIQLGNLAQTFNSRLSYFLLESLFVNGTALVGIYSVALLVSEKALVVPRSLGRVQYAETATNAEKLSLRTTQYFKLYIVLAFMVMALLMVVPNSLYVWIFGADFENVGYYIRLLIPAMILLMGSNAMSNYFAGRGLYKVNSLCTIIALVFSSIMAIILIPSYANLGAALSTTAAFATLCLSQLWYFNKINPDLPKNWMLPNNEDWQILKTALRKIK